VVSGVLLFFGVRRVEQIFFMLDICTVSKTDLLPVAVKRKKNGHINFYFSFSYLEQGDLLVIL
jgi:hypothetical protein